MNPRLRWSMWVLIVALMLLPYCVALASDGAQTTFTAYAYCKCSKCCGKWAGGNTASGTVPTEGRTIAADWKVLKPGTVVEIEGVGVRVVEDRGVTGHSIDIYMDSHEKALRFGMRKVKVKILSGQADIPAPAARPPARGASTPRKASAASAPAKQIRMISDDEVLASFELIEDDAMRLIEISMWRARRGKSIMY